MLQSDRMVRSQINARLLRQPVELAYNILASPWRARSQLEIAGVLHTPTVQRFLHAALCCQLAHIDRSAAARGAPLHKIWPRAQEPQTTDLVEDASRAEREGPLATTLVETPAAARGRREERARMDFVETQAQATPEVAEDLTALGELFSKKLYHELTTALADLRAERRREATGPALTRSGGEVPEQGRSQAQPIAVRHDFRGSCGRCGRLDRHHGPEGIERLKKAVEDKRGRLGAEPSLYLEMEAALLALRGADAAALEQVKKALEEAKPTMDGLTGTTDTAVFRKYYAAASDYSETGRATRSLLPSSSITFELRVGRRHAPEQKTYSRDGRGPRRIKWRGRLQLRRGPSPHHLSWTP